MTEQLLDARAHLFPFGSQFVNLARQFIDAAGGGPRRLAGMIAFRLNGLHALHQLVSLLLERVDKLHCPRDAVLEIG